MLFEYITVLEPGRHYARHSQQSQSRQNQQQPPQHYAPSSGNQNYKRRESLSSVSYVSGNHPSLPKSGAQKLAKQSSKVDMHEDWMKTPDAGQSG